MATHASILSLVFSMTDGPEISEPMPVPKTHMGFDEGPLKIVYEKEQKRFFLENGAFLCKIDGTEDYMIYFNDIWFKARVEFKSLE